MKKANTNNIGSAGCSNITTNEIRIWFHPALFMQGMVASILKNLKTNTRRIVKGFAFDYLQAGFTPEYVADPGNFSLCPYGKAGDIIWVKESHYQYGKWVKDGTTKTGKQKWKFVQDSEFVETRYFDNPPAKIERGHTPTIGWYKRSSMFMPFSCCRIYLLIKSIMVERLQDIDEEDAVAEGVEFYEDDVLGIRFKDYMADASGYGDSDVDFPTISTAKQSFQTLWKLINGEKSWEDNVLRLCDVAEKTHLKL